MLLQQMQQHNLKSKEAGDVIVAAGMSDYVPGEDATIAAVFERADNLMYQNKSELKAK